MKDGVSFEKLSAWVAFVLLVCIIAEVLMMPVGFRMEIYPKIQKLVADHEKLAAAFEKHKSDGSNIKSCQCRVVKKPKQNWKP
ncbi:MAG TPA: hypothetical protein V6D12_14075 [Candidatus Obscuribacterales bacterium]